MLVGGWQAVGLIPPGYDWTYVYEKQASSPTRGLWLASAPKLTRAADEEGALLQRMSSSVAVGINFERRASGGR